MSHDRLDDPRRLCAYDRALSRLSRSVTSGGDGSNVQTNWDLIKRDNPHIKLHSGRRGYVSCTATPRSMRADFKVVDRVTLPDRPVSSAGVLVVEAGHAAAFTD